MRELICLMMLIALAGDAGAMNLLSGPETVVYDSTHDRYLVSNMNEPCYIVAIDRDGRQSIFKSGLSWPHGMTIVENTLYVCTNYGTRGGILGFDLSNGDVVFEKLSTAWHDRCNAPTADTSGNLYITTFPSSVYRIRLSDGAEFELANSITLPNGPHFDARNNRVLVPTEVWDSVLYTIDAGDYSVSTIPVKYKRYSCITEDQFHNIYITAFFEGEIYRFDSNLTSPPELVSSGHAGPEGICFNQAENLLVVPNLLANSISYLDMFIYADADTTWGWPPREVNFTGDCDYDASTWTWDFGDGDSAFVQSPTHIYQDPGVYDVNLVVDTLGGSMVRNKRRFIVALADTITASSVMVKANDVVEVTVYGRNIMPVELLHIPMEYGGTLGLVLDSFSLAGCRTEALGSVMKAHSDASDKEATFRIYSVNPETQYLEPGYGPILKAYFTTASWAAPGQTATISLDGYSTYMPEFRGLYVSSYAPATAGGTVGIFACGDANSDRNVNLLDVTFTVNFLYKNGPEPNPPQAADANGDANINILDVTHLVNYLYKSGPDPAC